MTRSKKDTLLFVHGMCHGAWCWEEHFIPFFEEAGYNCLAIDLDGHETPGSSSPIHQFRLRDYQKTIVQAIEQIGTPPILVGHSMGGMLVQRYLRQWSCKKAVLMASVPPQGAFAATLRMIRRNPRNIKHAFTRNLLKIFLKDDEILFGKEIDPAKKARYREKLCAESFTAYLELLLPLRNRGKIRDTSILVIGGDQDKVVSEREMTRTARIYGAELQVIPGGTHDLMLDPRHELVARQIQAWIEA